LITIEWKTIEREMNRMLMYNQQSQWFTLRTKLNSCRFCQRFHPILP